jgi:hypothetical protein
MPIVNLAVPPDRSQFQIFDRLPQFVRRHVIDIPEAIAKKGVALIATDVLESVPVDPNTIVTGGWVRVITPCTAGATISVGDGASAAGYVAAGASAAAAANTVYGFNGALIQSGVTPFATTGGKYYATADTIDITLAGTPPTVGQLEVVVIGFSLNY